MKKQFSRTEPIHLDPRLAKQGGRAMIWMLPALALSASVALATQERVARPPAKRAVAPADTSKMLESSATPVSAPATKDSSETAALQLTVGKSTVMRLPEAVDRISIGNPAVADITLLRPNELYLLGKSFGSTNVILWRGKGRSTVYEVQVGVDVAPLRKHLRELWPTETDVKVGSAASSIVLSGGVRSAPVAEQMMRLAEAYAAEINRTTQAGSSNVESQPAGASQGSATGNSASARPIGTPQRSATGAQVVNLLQVLNPQQVMLEVKVAEINRTYLESLGVNMNNTANGGMTYSLVSNFFSGAGAVGSGTLTAINSGGDSVAFKALAADGLVKILAEPNILALSGQEGSFLAGGRLLVPVAQQGQGGTAGALSLEEKEYGVGLKFTPVVLENGRIHLRVAPEVSELVQRSVSDSKTVVLPQFTTRRASSTVQLMDGQSLAIAGLIKNNVSEQLTRIPLLGELPILGALFRSADFINERTELVFIVTPRLIKPLPADYKLPTDNFEPPSRYRFMIEGKLEGARQNPEQK